MGVTLRQTYDITTGQPQPFKYRIWGKIYICKSCPTNVIADVLYIKLDKVEMVN